MPEPSSLLVGAFVAVVGATVVAAMAATAAAAHRAGGRAGFEAGVAAVTLGALCAITAAMAATGVLRNFTQPPPMVLLVGAIAVATVALGLSPYGRRLVAHLPLQVLIGFSAFRLPLELVMHRAAAEGVMPAVMSYSGRNFDLVTGATAAFIAMGYWRRTVPTWVALGWNLVGFALLVNVVTIAILATPLFDRFPDQVPNIWVTYVPFVWLPTVLVPLALLSHLLVLRKVVSRGAVSVRQVDAR